MTRTLAISCAFLLSGLTAFAQPTTISAVGARDVFDCEGEGPLGGLYKTERGGYVCVRDFGRLVEISVPSQHFSARLQSDGKGNLVGRAFLSGWGWRVTHTPTGVIGEQMTCPFEMELRVFPLVCDELIWEYPIVSYDTACCNFGGVRYAQEHLTRVD